MRRPATGPDRRPGCPSIVGTAIRPLPKGTARRALGRSRMENLVGRASPPPTPARPSQPVSLVTAVTAVGILPRPQHVGREGVGWAAAFTGYGNLKRVWY